VTIPIDGCKVHLTGQHLIIFGKLFNNKHRHVHPEELLDAMYTGVLNPPDKARNVLGVIMTQLRQKLRPTKFRIVNHPSSHVSNHHSILCGGYRLVRLGFNA